MAETAQRKSQAEEYREMINKFLYVIKQNAEIYDKACVVAKLHANLSDASELLGKKMEDIRRITEELMSNWGGLQETIHKLLDNTNVKGIN